MRKSIDLTIAAMFVVAATALATAAGADDKKKGATKPTSTFGEIKGESTDLDHKEWRTIKQNPKTTTRPNSGGATATPQ
jgi:hypothetical protein